MKHPWIEISLSDYENHMQLASVMQLQTLNKIMKGQIDAYSASKVMILGIAGGNGLEHISRDRFKKVYGVDVNPLYLETVRSRYAWLREVLECLCIDLLNEADQLPKADLVIANLVIEYIGCPCFQKALRYVEPEYVSCVIQINAENNWVSDSPYVHVFDILEHTHYQIEEQALRSAMLEIGYHAVKTLEYALPDGKRLMQIEFKNDLWRKAENDVSKMDCCL